MTADANKEAMGNAAFTVERIAKITASLDLDPALQADILAANELDEEGWDEIEATYDAALRSELEAGDTSRLEAFDAAYVARIEEERGPISAEDYASLLRAGRSGSTSARLAELEIPEAAELTVMRVFERRLAGDDAAKRGLYEALERDGG